MIRSRRRRAAARSLVLLRLVQACTSCGRLEMISVWLLVLKLLVGTQMFVVVVDDDDDFPVVFFQCVSQSRSLHTLIVHHPLFKNEI